MERITHATKKNIYITRYIDILYIPLTGIESKLVIVQLFVQSLILDICQWAGKFPDYASHHHHLGLGHCTARKLTVLRQTPTLYLSTTNFSLRLGVDTNSTHFKTECILRSVQNIIRIRSRATIFVATISN